ncbi:MAG: carbonic anhydrase [Bacteroidales bacterium]|jgi:carbonic anhydrase
MNRLVPITKTEDIFPDFRDTSIGLLLEYHNLKRKYEEYSHATLLIGMCMDNRKYLSIPENFAYIMRTGGANIRPYEFQISYAIAVGKIRCIALIGHTDCGMSDLLSKREKFVSGLVEYGGWNTKDAKKHFDRSFSKFETGDEIDYTLTEVSQLRLKYPKVLVAPLFYKLEDNLIYQIKE